MSVRLWEVPLLVIARKAVNLAVKVLKSIQVKHVQAPEAR